MSESQVVSEDIASRVFAHCHARLTTDNFGQAEVTRMLKERTTELVQSSIKYAVRQFHGNAKTVLVQSEQIYQPKNHTYTPRSTIITMPEKKKDIDFYVQASRNVSPDVALRLASVYACT